MSNPEVRTERSGPATIVSSGDRRSLSCNGCGRICSISHGPVAQEAAGFRQACPEASTVKILYGDVAETGMAGHGQSYWGA